MSLGCKLPPRFLAQLKQHVKNVGLKRDAAKQMDKAFNGPQKYQAGTPYDFKSPSLYNVILAGGPPKECKYFDSDIVNVEWLGGEKMASLRDRVRGAKEEKEKEGKEQTQRK